jgi:outer membrane protein TolC
MPQSPLTLVFCALTSIFLGAQLSLGQSLETATTQPAMPKFLHLETVLSLVESDNPLLHGSRTEKLAAQGKYLEALGAFEPVLVNDWELERLVKDGRTKSVGFNDSFVRLRHPYGIQGIAGWRMGLGDIEIADLAVDRTNQPLLGIVLPLLRGLGINPQRAQLEKSKLADREATLTIQQTRQDLYLGAATQFWKWVASRKAAELKREALKVAKVRLKQISGQAKAGAVPEFDVAEATQEVQRRLENFIRAKREAEQEEFRLSLFIWRNGSPIPLKHYEIPDFPPLPKYIEAPAGVTVVRTAQERRPEVLQIELEAAMNDIDLSVAKNNLLPSLIADAEPSRKPGEFVLGLGYRFGIELSFPFMQREARGQKIQVEAKGTKLGWMLQFRMQEVAIDIDNAFSAISRAHERIQAAYDALVYAQTLVKGELTRFRMGATNLLFVNLRERNAVEAEIAYIQAQAEFHQAKALYEWAVGNWTQPQT